MEAAQETRVYTVHMDAIEPLRRELDARVRLRYEVLKRPWWQPPDRVKIAITGPAFALDALPPIIEAMEQQAYTERQW